MAYMHFTPIGAIIELTNSETDTAVYILQNSATGASAISSMLNVVGTNGPAELLASTLHAIFCIGETTLRGCNSSGNGIFLHVLWVGLYWCTPR
jgi:hypothetical protein